MAVPEQLAQALSRGSAEDKLAAAEQLARLESEAQPAAMTHCEIGWLRH
jgi:hypothetical protein